MKLPPVSQIGFVVPDLQGALGSFSRLFGAFTVRRFENTGYEYRGKLCDCVVDVAFALSGALEIEVIQPVSGEGPHREFLAAGRSGLHHMQYRAEDIAPYVHWLEAQGYGCIWRRRSADLAVAYMTRDDDPVVVELVEPLVRARRTVGGEG
jgi:methylmalonyl-CoA/ethylmalonyl-CoA epimerase